MTTMALVHDNTQRMPEAGAGLPAWGDTKAWSRLETVAFHLTLLVFFVAAQLVQIPTRIISADNSWHFRLARDVVSGEHIYWAAVDANRLFPDLLFSIVAFVLPGGSIFSTWIYNYHAVHCVALYISLVALAASLFDHLHRRRLYFFFIVAALSALLIALPFWGFWLLVPGNHGAGLPVVFLCLALLFSMNQARMANGAGAIAFVLMIALVIASNRLLLISFVVPLVFALVLAAALHRRGASLETQPQRIGVIDTAAGSFLVLVLMTAVAGVLGFLMWRVLASLSWHKLVAPGGTPNLEFSLDWANRVLTKEATELRATMSTDVALDIGLGVLILVMAIVAGGFVLVRALRNRPLAADEENRVMLSTFTALSALAAMAFTVVKTDDSGSWHYRYIAMSLAFAVVSLVSLPVWLGRLAIPRRGLTALAVVTLSVALVGISFSAERRYITGSDNEAVIQRSISDLARLIGRHSNSSKLRGYAEYWVANDISTRSDVLQIGILDSVTAVFRFYNNNASDLCGDDHFFVLHSPEKNEPKRDHLVAILGEPIRIERTVLEPRGPIDVLYYDPAVLREKITLPGRGTAEGLFPGFRCERRD